MTINIGITEKNRKHITNELSKILADEFVLFTKTKKAHWNVEGIDFYEKHNFFEAQANQIDEFIDNIAERIRTLGHYTPASLKSYLELTQLAEPISKYDSQSLINALLADHEIIIIQLRRNINIFANDYDDPGTSDFITGLMKDHEKMAWFLRSLLK
ncbi:Dps family protein [Pedobacter alluvionis]|uniref:DNA starvation/stationary phase protection protein n=1 Tax=Pedobacter alluvionis TaxID=475253 RepID=A0A497YEB6_9SPHI|nr:DNA starvation/stationary phase protection protein [Pedobacter alluvionis]RLJ80989.1 starvation-inducible DNA-binding protein [Pedobacter alluvionis]TFB27898.1 DNA starvation/stationary phase protection protein [Pedobacter alluvionis]